VLDLVLPYQAKRLGNVSEVTYFVWSGTKNSVKQCFVVGAVVLIMIGCDSRKRRQTY